MELQRHRPALLGRHPSLLLDVPLRRLPEIASLIHRALHGRIVTPSDHDGKLDLPRLLEAVETVPTEPLITNLEERLNPSP